MTFNQTIFNIPTVNLYNLEKKICMLNKRAIKLNCKPIAFKIIRHYLISQDNFDYLGRKMQMTEIEIIGNAPQFNGWSFVAKLEHTEAGNLINAVPNSEIPEKYKTTGNYCDHCKTDRTRKYYYILKHDDGSFVQVGKTCLKDFLGHQDPQKLAKWAETLLDFINSIEGEDGYGGTRSNPHYCLKSVLATSLRVIKREGFKSKDKDNPTSSLIAWLYNPPPSSAKKAYKRWLKEWKHYHPDDISLKAANKIIEWIKTHSDDSAYIHNLKVIADLGGFASNRFGIVVSAAWIYLKEIEEYQVQKSNEYIGDLGVRDIFDLTYQKYRKIKSDFYEDVYMYIIMFEDSAGNSIVWWTSSVHETLEHNLLIKEVKLIEGKIYRIKGTIKAHQEYKGRKQTSLNRCVIVT